MVHYHISHVDNRNEAERVCCLLVLNLVSEDVQYNLFGYEFVKKECHALPSFLFLKTNLSNGLLL